MNKIVFIQLNEINFDLVERYIEQGLSLPYFKVLVESYKSAHTISENAYDHLEPWIQWYSFYSGLSFKEHGVFRLGDSVSQKTDSNLFSELESEGFRIGAISPMNVVNNLVKPLILFLTRGLLRMQIIQVFLIVFTLC